MLSLYIYLTKVWLMKYYYAASPGHDFGLLLAECSSFTSSRRQHICPREEKTRLSSLSTFFYYLLLNYIYIEVDVAYRYMDITSSLCPKSRHHPPHILKYLSRLDSLYTTEGAQVQAQTRNPIRPFLASTASASPELSIECLYHGCKLVLV